ncbi:MAG: outer membrane lipoprotein carrier protein LolA [Xanthomonadaceae bacterium]|nr:outer membrane lipoprotein carrier protein LolA [Xanthomonadaceae bacterium]
MLRNIAALIVFASTATAAPVSAGDLAESLLAGMAKTPPVSTPFVEVSYRGVLDQPLIVSGTLRWLGGDRMERDIAKPFSEVAKIGDGQVSVQRGDREVHSMPLSRAPQVGAMLAGFRALLGGDVSSLQQDFTLSAVGGEARWVISLVPKTGQLKQQLVSIVIDGRGHEPRCLTVRNTNGDSSITLVGAMVRQGLQSVAPLESALAVRCRDGGR